MTRNSVYITVALVGLGVAFGVLCLLVWASRGHPGLIRHKLRVGAIIVSLTAMLAGGAVGCHDTHISCYAVSEPDAGPGPENRVQMENEQNGVIEIDRAQSSVVSGSISNVQGHSFSFRLVGQQEAVFQLEDIDASDGAFDEHTEEFEFLIRTDIPEGGYSLRFYSVSASQQNSRPDAVIARFMLNIQ